MVLTQLIIYALAFVGIWVGAGLAIKSVERLSSRLKLSSFAVSFLILGFFTSVSELSVGINSVVENDPEIFVGNLIGASIVLSMLTIPLLAITGSKINIAKEFRGVSLIMSLATIGLPVILSMDGRINQTDGFIAIIFFIILVLFIQTKKGLFNKETNIKNVSSAKIGKEFFKIILGLAIIFIASRFVVSQTIYFSNILGVSPFLISLLVISIGTNIPELSFVLRSMFMRSNQVAFGDYIGSASFNTFIFGILALWYGKTINLTNSYLVSLSFLIVGLIGFYHFARTKNSISRLEGLALLSLYIIFLAVEIIIHS